MADNNRDDMSSDLNFGILDTSVMGDYKAVEGFLSGEITKVEDENSEEEEETPIAGKKPVVAIPKKPVPIKKEPEKKPIDNLFDQEEGEEGKDDDEEEGKKSTPKEGEEKDEEDEKDEDAPSENPYEDLAADLLKLGVLSQDDENEKLPSTGPELLAKFNAEKQKGATQWLDGFLSRFGEDRRELFEAIFVGGVEPADYLPVYNELQSLEALDMSVEKNQELVYREFYKRLKFSPEDIDTKVQKAKDYGDLEVESKTFHARIVAQDKELLAEQEANKEAKKNNEAREDLEYKTNITKILAEKLKTKEFKGVPLDDKLARQAFDFLYTKKYKAKDGTLLTDFDKFVLETKRPENHENRVLLAILQLTNFDFTKIAKKAVSEESSELFNSFVQKKTKKTAGAKAASPASKSWLAL